jgi:opacity protein-like surface antigen
MNKKWLVAMLGVAAVSLSAGAIAQQKGPATGFYVGGDFGQTDVEDVDEDTSWKILGGYQVNRTFAVELGYANLFDKRVSGIDVEVTAWDLVGVASFPLGDRFSVFGKLGFAMWEAKVNAGVLGSAKDDGTDLTFGAGLQYDVSRNLGIRGQWQRYDVDADADLLSIGLIYRFN